MSINWSKTLSLGLLMLSGLMLGLSTTLPSAEAVLHWTPGRPLILVALTVPLVLCAWTLRHHKHGRGLQRWHIEVALILAGCWLGGFTLGQVLRLA